MGEVYRGINDGVFVKKKREEGTEKEEKRKGKGRRKGKGKERTSKNSRVGPDEG